MPWEPWKTPPAQELGRIRRDLQKKARFLVDESLGEGVASVLRKLRWNAVFVRDVGLLRHDDTDVFAFAWNDDRILLTHDRDFLNERRFPPHRNPGVVILPGASGNDRALIRALALMLCTIAPYRETFRGAAIEIGEDETVSVRSSSNDGKRSTTRWRFIRGRAHVWRE